MIATLAASSIPLVLAGQLVALSLLWRRYRMPGSGWWLVATILICLATTAQAVEETGWRPWPLVALVNAMAVWGATTEVLAARVLTGAPLPDRRRLGLLLGLGVVYAFTAAWQADRHADDLLVFGLLRAPGNALILVAEAAVALALVRLSRRTATSGGLVAASGYALLVAIIPVYPVSFSHPWLRTTGMVVSAVGFVLVGSGMLLLLMERPQERETARQLQEAVPATDADVTPPTGAPPPDPAGDDADLASLAVGLARDLLSSVDVLRQSSFRLRGNMPPIERDDLAERVAVVLRDLSAIATGVLAAGDAHAPAVSRIDVRKVLERLLLDLVPPTTGVMKAWPAPQVWLTADETLLGVALHQVIRCQVTADQPVSRLAVVLSTAAGLSLTVQQNLDVRGLGDLPSDQLGLKVAQLAARRLGGHLEVQLARTGNTLVLHLPATMVDAGGDAAPPPG